MGRGLRTNKNKGSSGYVPSQYVGVHGRHMNQAGRYLGLFFIAVVKRRNAHYWNSKPFNTEREAALAYDKKQIELGLEPVNILKRKA